MLNEIEKNLLRKLRFCNSFANSHPIKGWLWYEITEETLPISREERSAVQHSPYLEFDQVFSSLLGKEVEALRLLPEKFNLAIKQALEEDPELTGRDLGVPLWYWRSEIK